MAGIYLHIPFCRKTCHYCDFHFSTSLKSKDAVLLAMIKEMEQRKEYLGQSPTIDTIYFGGGTPSLLEYAELNELLEAVYKHFKVAENAEITLEANPDDLTIEKIAQLKKNNINRLSIGVQSFFNDDLKLLNRIHSGEDAKTAILASQDAGFDNITIDFIYAIPGLDDNRWRENLAMGIELNVPHISAYCLTVEEKTPLEAFIKKGQIKPVDEAQSIRQFEILMDTLEGAGFEHYEISNFAKPNMCSRHNSSYWSGTHYLGIGPSAHSFDSNGRQWNVSHNIKYANALIKGDETYFEKELLTLENKANEYTLTKLRLKEGLNLAEYDKLFGAGAQQLLLHSATQWLGDQYLLLTNNHLQLTRKGKFVADRITSDLFI